MEFKLISPETFVQVIEFNYDELQKWITDQVEKYQGIVYSEETIKKAKEDRAELNKFRERVDTARKDVKKRYLEPYNLFEEKVKNLLALIEEPAAAIDKQVKAYEDRQKADKKEQITEYFTATAGDLLKLITLDKIFNQKWLNTTVNIKSVQTEIDQILVKVKFDLQTIKDLKSEWEFALIDTYLNTLDVSAALREKTRLEERKKEIAKPPLEEVKKEIEQPDIANEQPAEPKIYERKFWVRGTADELRALGKYMKEHGIEYGGIE